MRRFSRRPRRRILPRSSPAELTEVDRLELGRSASVGERDSYRDLAALFPATSESEKVRFYSSACQSRTPKLPRRSCPCETSIMARAVR
jgi:hypothetical protein